MVKGSDILAHTSKASWDFLGRSRHPMDGSLDCFLESLSGVRVSWESSSVSATCQVWMSYDRQTSLYGLDISWCLIIQKPVQRVCTAVWRICYIYTGSGYPVPLFMILVNWLGRRRTRCAHCDCQYFGLDQDGRERERV